MGQFGGGETGLAVPADEAAGSYALIDPESIGDADVAAATLRNAAGSGDRLIVTVPAFVTTSDGDVTGAAGPYGASVLRRQRNGLQPISDVMGQPLPTMERRELVVLDAAGGTAVLGAAPGRSAHHEAAPSQLGHPGMPGAGEVHAAGVALAGPVVGQLAGLMRERAAADMPAFVGLAQRTVTTVAAGTGASSFAVPLETISHGVTGDASLRAVAVADFRPGQGWLALKASIEAATGIDLDPLIDSGTFDEDTLAAALDLAILKTRDGAVQAATALTAAIGRAEDFVYIETPAIDPLTAGGGALYIVGSLSARLAARPALKILLCVPEKFQPGQPAKLELVRKGGINAALAPLAAAAPDRVVLFTPAAGPGRPLHMVSTVVIVDDTFLLAGPTHLWRRGLTFDSALSIALFDETSLLGRGAALCAARRQLLADCIGLSATFVGMSRSMLKSSW